jgi:serine/threonine protein kinase
VCKQESSAPIPSEPVYAGAVADQNQDLSLPEPGHQENSIQETPHMPGAPGPVDDESTDAHGQESGALQGEAPTVLHGRKVLEQVGSGSFGKVHMAVELKTGSKQVLKVTEKSQMAMKEVRCLSQLTEHPHIIKLFDWTFSNKDLCMFLQYGGSRNLEQAQGDQVDQRFQISMAVDLFNDVQKAVIHLHRCNVCHLDIKQANVMVGDDEVIRLTDFGSAGNISKPIMHPCGTLPFAAPEVLDTFTKNVSKYYSGDLADCFSMGVLLFELCFGLDSMKEQFGWKNMTTKKLFNHPDRRASEMRKVLLHRHAWCQERLSTTQDMVQNEQALLFALCTLLDSDAFMRPSMILILLS